MTNSSEQNPTETEYEFRISSEIFNFLIMSWLVVFLTFENANAITKLTYSKYESDNQSSILKIGLDTPKRGWVQSSRLNKSQAGKIKLN